MTTTAAPVAAGGSAFPDRPDVVVFSPYRAGLPNLRRYVSDAWARRHFAYELARTELRSMHFNTVFGQIWLILNPLLLTAVYYLLTGILSHRKGGAVNYLSYLMSGLFAYYFFMQSANHAANSVVKGGRLIMNTAFPKVLLPVSSVLVGFMRFLPTIGIYLVIHALARQTFSVNMLWALIPLAELFLFTIGFSLLVAVANVYFRDTRSFLPYLLRIWLYLSPVLYYGDKFPAKYWPMKYVNPLFPILDGWSVSLGQGGVPELKWLVAGAFWGVITIVVGGYLFVSRERDFAVRI